MENNFQFEQFVSKNGITYMSVGTNFTDARNVYIDDTSKCGMIVFSDSKPVYNGHKHMVTRYTKGFVFEQESGVEISCKDYKNIAKHIYELNDLFKNYKSQNSGDNGNNNNNGKGSER